MSCHASGSARCAVPQDVSARDYQRLQDMKASYGSTQKAPKTTRLIGGCDAKDLQDFGYRYQSPRLVTTKATSFGDPPSCSGVLRHSPILAQTAPVFPVILAEAHPVLFPNDAEAKPPAADKMQGESSVGSRAGQAARLPVRLSLDPTRQSVRLSPGAPRGSNAAVSFQRHRHGPACPQARICESRSPAAPRRAPDGVRLAPGARRLASPDHIDRSRKHDSADAGRRNTVEPCLASDLSSTTAYFP